MVWENFTLFGNSVNFNPTFIVCVLIEVIEPTVLARPASHPWQFIDSTDHDSIGSVC